jgi:hypothetical protein
LLKQQLWIDYWLLDLGLWLLRRLLLWDLVEGELRLILLGIVIILVITVAIVTALLLVVIVPLEVVTSSPVVIVVIPISVHAQKSNFRKTQTSKKEGNELDDICFVNSLQ